MKVINISGDIFLARILNNKLSLACQSKVWGFSLSQVADYVSVNFIHKANDLTLN